MSRLHLPHPHRATRPAGRGDRTAGPNVHRAPPSHEPLVQSLERWVADDLLTREQAAAILAGERERAARATPARPVPVVAELVGYLGATLALAGAIALAASFWTDLPVWARLAILGITSALFLTAGVAVGEDAVQGRRLRGFLLLLSSAAAASFAAVLATEVLDADDDLVTLVIGLVLAAHAGASWRLRPRPLQQLACLAGLAAAAAGAGGLAGGQVAAGLGVWAVGVAWVALGWRGKLPPAAVALGFGALTTLIGSSMITGDRQAAGLLFTLATALGLLAAGTVRRRFVMAAVGTAGVMMTLPATIDWFFAGTVSVPLGILLSGLILLAVTLLMLRRPPPRPR
jgi:hypothetical protein